MDHLDNEAINRIRDNIMETIDGESARPTVTALIEVLGMMLSLISPDNAKVAKSKMVSALTEFEHEYRRYNNRDKH